MCDCIERTDELLKKYNTEVSATMPLKAGMVPQMVVVTNLLEKKRGAKPATLVASYCPACGEKYPEASK